MTHLQFNNRPAAKSFDPFFNNFFQIPSAWVNPSANAHGHPAVNITDTANAYQLELNVPGRNKEDFKISIDKDLLSISFEKKEEAKEEGVNTVRREFSFNSFKRSFTLDDRIDTTGIQAKYENGILKIELPKKEQVKQEAKQISVN